MILTIRIFIGVLFVFSGILKLTDLISFHDTIEQFNILPDYMINYATVSIPALEVICGLFFLLNVFKKGVLYILIPLMIIFIGAVSINLFRGAEFECGCFGPLQIFNTISIYSVLFDLVLLGALCYVFLNDKESVDTQGELKIILSYTLLLTFFTNTAFSHTNLENTLKSNNIPNIDWDIALSMLEDSDAVLFDARPNLRYERDHVPNSLSLPFHDFPAYYKKYSHFERSRPVIIYCDGIDCNASQRLAFKFAEKKYSNLYIIKSGWAGWKARQ